MYCNLIISIVAGLINLVLSAMIPCLLKDSNVNFLTNIKKVFSNNKELILTSSLIVVILVYLSLSISSISPQIVKCQIENLSKLNINK